MGLNWTVSQIGARQHYGVPRGFYYKDQLSRLYTDAWCRWGASLLGKGPESVRAFAGRYHPDLPSSKVTSFNFRSSVDRICYPRTNTTFEELYRGYLRIGHWFAASVGRHLKRQRLDPGRDVFFGFNTGCLETFETLRPRGIICICDQIDPARVEEDLIFEEAERWPGWQKTPGRIPEQYWQRMDAEWAAASIVLVNSQWTREAMIRQNVPAEKILIIPLAYEPVKMHIPARRNLDKPITVLWIGSVILRKGIQYLIEAAKRLKDNANVRFVVIGPIEISEQALTEAPDNMQFLGRITRGQTLDWYRKADLFVLPTLSDGFAISQVEAMAQALPVIATPNCGRVVTDGVDGLIVPPRDAEALTAAIDKLESNRQLLREMSYRALDKSAHFYLPRQAQLLEEAVMNHLASRPLNQTEHQILPDASHAAAT